MTNSFLSTTNPFGANDNQDLPVEDVAARLMGEVVETSLTGYIAQTYKLDEPPPFGGLVRVKDRGGNCEIYGVVYASATGGLDPGRRAATRGTNQPPASDKQVYTDNPQLSRLLKTEFSVLVLGCHQAGAGRFSYVFPDYPPPLHYGVTLCGDAMLERFTQENGYMRAILEAGQIPSEELLAAFLRRASRVRGAVGRAYLVETLRYLARQLKQDYDRFRIIVEKCEAD